MSLGLQNGLSSSPPAAGLSTTRYFLLCKSFALSKKDRPAVSRDSVNRDRSSTDPASGWLKLARAVFSQLSSWPSLLLSTPVRLTIYRSYLLFFESIFDASPPFELYGPSSVAGRLHLFPPPPLFDTARCLTQFRPLFTRPSTHPPGGAGATSAYRGHAPDISPSLFPRYSLLVRTACYG